MVKVEWKDTKKHLHSIWRLSFPGFDFELWERVVFICLFVQKLTPAPFFLQFKAVLKLFCPLWGLTHFNYCTCVFMWLTVPKKKKNRLTRQSWPQKSAVTKISKCSHFRGSCARICRRRTQWLSHWGLPWRNSQRCPRFGVTLKYKRDKNKVWSHHWQVKLETGNTGNIRRTQSACYGFFFFYGFKKSIDKVM